MICAVACMCVSVSLCACQRVHVQRMGLLLDPRHHREHHSYPQVNEQTHISVPVLTTSVELETTLDPEGSGVFMIILSPILTSISTPSTLYHHRMFYSMFSSSLSPSHSALMHALIQSQTTRGVQLDKYCITCGACNPFLDYLGIWRVGSPDANTHTNTHSPMTLT